MDHLCRIIDDEVQKDVVPAEGPTDPAAALNVDGYLLGEVPFEFWRRDFGHGGATSVCVFEGERVV